MQEKNVGTDYIFYAFEGCLIISEVFTLVLKVSSIGGCMQTLEVFATEVKVLMDKKLHTSFLRRHYSS